MSEEAGFKVDRCPVFRSVPGPDSVWRPGRQLDTPSLSGGVGKGRQATASGQDSQCAG